MLNSGQSFGYRVMKSGFNTFVTGGAGVGKTYLVNKFIQDMRELGKNVMVCAPTGIAAQSLDGCTLHRQFSIPLGVVCDYLKYAYSSDDVLEVTDVIIIDEISMCRIDTFDFVMNRVAYANKSRNALGKPIIQIIVVGDFMQLAPVLSDVESKILNKHYKKDVGAGFAFNSMFWGMCKFKTVLLTEIMRQERTELEFMSNLNRIRAGEKAYIDFIYKSACPNYIEGAITLCGTNSEVNAINTDKLSKLDEVEVEFLADIEYLGSEAILGPVRDNEVRCELSLKLKAGARIMTLFNDDSKGYKNGTLGTVEEIYDNEVLISLDDGFGVVSVQRVDEEVMRYEIEEDVYADTGDTEMGISMNWGNKVYRIKKNKVAIVRQFPIKLAYAVTIHKSQGQTYNAVNISPYSWDCGQLYVALSRATSIHRIHFNYEPDVSYIVVSLSVIKFYNDLKYVTEQEVEEKGRENEKKKRKEHESGHLDSGTNSDINTIMHGLLKII